MARIVLTSFGSFGDVNPYIGLGLALQKRGHTPVLAMPRIYRQVVESLGLGFHAVRPDVDPDDRQLLARVMDAGRGSEVLMREILMPAVADSYADLMDATEGADLLVSHPAALAGPVVGERLGRPWASSVLAPLSFFSVTDPMVPPPAPWLYPVLAASPLASGVFRRLAGVITRTWAGPLRQLRRSLGMPPGRNPVLDGQHSPHLVLALFSRVLADPQADWPAHVTLTGPILYNGAATPALSAELEQFLAAGPPPLVFTLGTSAVEAAGSFYEVSAHAARALGRRAVLLVGRHAHNRPSGLGDTILALEYAPHATLFPRAAAIVHQGGAGTLHQALVSGRPTLVVPHAHDQPDNAMRVARLGVSRTVYPKSYDEATVVRELDALLSSTAYEVRAAEVGSIVSSEAGAAAAANALERLLSDRGRPAAGRYLTGSRS